MAQTDIIVLGGPATGKTHYAGQLIGRLRHYRQGLLRLVPGGTDDLSKFEEVLSCLEEGKTAGHTPSETWVGMKCKVETEGGKEYAIEWPDYAGERLTSVLEKRRLPEQWKDLISVAKSWMLFIRPSTLKLYEDLLSRPTKISTPKKVSGTNQSGELGWDDRAQYVEILQILLFFLNKSVFNRITMPRIAIILSCWDELNESESPDQVLKNKLPLFYSFVANTWDEQSWSVWGLSSLGKALEPETRDEEFARKGPENFGYVLHQKSTDKDPDLTAPVAWLLEV